MLCDLIVESAGRPMGQVDASGFESIKFMSLIQPIVARISAAPKFILAGDFAAAADELAAREPELMKVLALCRLPFSECWIELAQSNRPHFLSGRPPNAMEKHPKRVGFLLTEMTNSESGSAPANGGRVQPPPRMWRAHMFWSYEPDHLKYVGDWSCCLIAMLVAPGNDLRVINNVQGIVAVPRAPHGSALWQRTHPLLADFAQEAAPKLLGSPERTARLLSMSSRDWGGEVAYLVAVLALLNTRNATETEAVDKSRQNHSRARAGKAPLADYHLLKISPRLKARMQIGKAGEHEHRALRGHFVRGHFKARASGVYWWSPFVRGDRARMVPKDYQPAGTPRIDPERIP